MKHVHFGIIGTDGRFPCFPYDLAVGAKRLPEGFLTDGDSFLVWGEGRPGSWDFPYDRTLHVIYPWDTFIVGSPNTSDIENLRWLLAGCLSDDQRLVDYAVVTNDEDWGEEQLTCLLDGTWL